MSLIGTDSAVAFAPQADKGTPAALGDSNFRWQLVRSMSLQPIQNQEFLELEIGGSLMPGGLYKTGYYGGGDMSLYPRVDADQMHYLLYSLGSTFATQELSAGVAHENFYGCGTGFTPPTAPVAGAQFDYTDATMAASGGGANRAQLYLTGKQLLPAPANDVSRGQIFEDLRPTGLQITSSKGAVMAQMGFQGRAVTFYESATGANWTPGNLAADDTVPVGCRGELNIGDTTVDIAVAQSVQVVVAPNLTSPNDEQGMFSYVPEEYNTTSWSVTFQLAFNLLDWTAFTRARYAAPSGGTRIWTPTPWIGDEPFWLEFLTPGAVHGAFDGSLGVWGNKVAWAMQPIQLTPGTIVGAMLVGRVLRSPTNDVEWFLRTVNSTAGAAWPT